jgi:hypothetical protein
MDNWKCGNCDLVSYNKFCVPLHFPYNLCFPLFLPLRDTSNPPPKITQRNAKLILSKGGLLDFGASVILPLCVRWSFIDSNFLYFFLYFKDHPLASDFDILDGQHNVTVPNVAVGDDYRIVRKSQVHDTSPLHTLESDIKI